MRLRIRFSKIGKIRFTSHRDTARIWERGLRRAGLPVAYSEGFTPRPRISFGLALPTGYESEAEYLDVELAEEAAGLSGLGIDGIDGEAAGSGLGIDGEAAGLSGLGAVGEAGWLSGLGADGEAAGLSGLAGALTEAVPAGITVLAAAGIDRAGPSLQEAVTSCTWRIDVDGVDEEAAAAAAARALDAGEILITRERKGRTVTDDIRSQIVSLDTTSTTADGIRLIAELGTKPRALRPSELLAGLDPSPRELRVRRLRQWIRTGSEQREPLEALPLPDQSPAADAARAANAKDHRDDRPPGRQREPAPRGRFAAETAKDRPDRQIRRARASLVGS